MWKRALRRVRMSQVVLTKLLHARQLVRLGQCRPVEVLGVHALCESRVLDQRRRLGWSGMGGRHNARAGAYWSSVADGERLGRRWKRRGCAWPAGWGGCLHSCHHTGRHGLERRTVTEDIATAFPEHINSGTGSRRHRDGVENYNAVGKTVTVRTNDKLRAGLRKQSGTGTDTNHVLGPRMHRKGRPGAPRYHPMRDRNRGCR
jgi:hypothetical protein